MATVYIGGVRAGRMAIGTTEIANILKGTSDPSSSIGSNGQLYLKYGGSDTRYTYSETLGGYVLNDYFYSEVNQLIGVVDDRTYAKVSSGAAIAVMWKNSTYSGPLLISTVESNTTYSYNTSGSLGSATIDGITWYLSTTNFWSNPVVDSLAPIIEADYYPTASSRLQEAIETILEASDFKTSLPTNVVTDSFAKVNDQWQNLIGTDIDAIQSGGELPVVPFEKEILHSIAQEQSENPAPVSVTFTKDYPIAFICGLIGDNVYTGAISVNALGGASVLYGLSGNRYTSAGIAIKLPSNKTLTGYFPYSDGGAYYDIFGAIGMSRLPSEYEIKATIDTSNISIELSKVYDHMVVFVGMDSGNSNSITLAMNGTSIPLTVENEKFSRYSYHASEELTSDSTTLNFTYSGGGVADNTIVVFAYNE